VGRPFPSFAKRMKIQKKPEDEGGDRGVVAKRRILNNKKEED